MKSILYFLCFFCLVFACTEPQKFDVIIRNGTVIDGTGNERRQADIGINADTIAAIGKLKENRAAKEIDASGLVVAPGFINMLSWSTTTLIEEGNAEGTIRQGVTLEVMGEGWSMGPLNEEMKKEEQESQKDIQFDVTWTTLGEYLQFLEDKGIATNVASFVGATTVRIHEIGEEDREPTVEELQNMKELVRVAMEEGALGVGSSLIYAPAFYAKTYELIALCKVASEYNGMYISHLRSEGDYWLEAIDELIEIAEEANVPAEIYHLKAAGKDNWYKLDLAIQKIDSARKAGLEITTNMYNYIAGATGLDAAMPPWVQEGGHAAWAKRLQDPETRKRVAEEMNQKGEDWENLFFAAGSADNLLLVGFRNDSLKHLTGKSLAEVAEMRGTTPAETAMDLVIQDGSRVGTVYFLMSEENVKRQIKIPYMSFGSDAGSMAPVPPFTNNSTHPRAYGNFARLLGKYVREGKVISLEEAIYKLTHLSASKLKIKKRGKLEKGFYADIAIFDADEITDKATFEDPHQFSEGVIHVFVNGTQVLENGNHTNAKPGRFIKGPGYKSSR